DAEDDNEDSNSLSDGQWSFEEEETKSRFTNYSLTSSVLPRSEALQTLDERFEKLFEQYDDAEIGALDGDDIAGYLHTESRVVNQLVEDYQAHKQQCTLKEFIKNKFEGLETGTVEQAEKEELIKISVNEKSKEEQWDCESVLSTYSNLYNHPKLITEPKNKPKPIVVSERSGVPTDVFASNKLTKKHLRQLNEENHDDVSNSEQELRVMSVASRNSVASTIRPKNETPEDRKARKCAVKQYQKERRAEKKANKLAFKMEEKRQEQITLNLHQNLQGIKLN
ncbi:protein LTV1 homolog, partial [Limulus polyphemus]|uniref:Protein LTV1 homolog n=1 Tax=Limulus polyphemus TaxID=6850 RepID=A0ABM1C081_LIMPO